MTHHASTKAVHAGENRPKPYGAITTPIIQTSTYTFADTSEILDFMERKEAGEVGVRDEYGRYSNPTQTVAEQKMAELEGGEEALLFSSGMAAFVTCLTAMLSSGDHLVMTSGSYHRSTEYALSFLSRWGIETSLVPIDQPEAIQAAVQPNTRLLFAESPTNPYLRVADLVSIREIAEEHAIVTMLDSTFAAPVNLRPLEYGVDLVMHSASKYLGGHNDLLAGVLVGSTSILADIKLARGVMGTMSNPNDAYLLVRGLKTLDVRLHRQNETGQRVAEFLEQHPAIERVHYPGLASHPDHTVAQRQMTGYGGVVTFEVNGGLEQTSRFIDNLHLPYIGPTLGGVESIIQQQALLYSLDPQERSRAGLKDNLVRYALGIEDCQDLIDDLDQALSAI
jgi:cystathionine gamma-synthase